jgi:G2/mitotic-specific cyclin 2
VFHSEYTEEQLIPGHELLVDKLTEKDFMSQWVCKKYAQRKFLKASIFAVRWALVYGKGEDVPVELFEAEEEE